MVASIAMLENIQASQNRQSRRTCLAIVPKSSRKDARSNPVSFNSYEFGRFSVETTHRGFRRSESCEGSACAQTTRDLNSLLSGYPVSGSNAGAVKVRTRHDHVGETA